MWDIIGNIIGITLFIAIFGAGLWLVVGMYVVYDEPEPESDIKTIEITLTVVKDKDRAENKAGGGGVENNSEEKTKAV